MLLANSGCVPFLKAGKGKDFKELEKCQQKIDSIYDFIENFNNIYKIIFIARGSKTIEQVGFGLIDNGLKKSGNNYIEFYENKQKYNHKKLYYKKLETTLNYLDQLKIPVFYILENPELGFHPKNCMVRPFNIFPNDCRLSYGKYFERQNEYRTKTIELASQYENITVLDPEKLYCDDKYCYAIKDGKMLYADDDHHSVDGSIKQARFFIDEIISDKVNNVN